MTKPKLVALLAAVLAALFGALFFGLFSGDSKDRAATPTAAAVGTGIRREAPEARKPALETPAPSAREDVGDAARVPAKLQTESKSTAADAGKTPAGWAAKYAKSNLAQLVAARDAMRIDLGNRSGPELKKMFASGSSKLVSETGKYQPTGADDEEIMALHVPDGGQATYRAALPRSQYPDLYALKDEIDWLTDAIAKKTAEAASKKPEAK